MSPPGSWRRVIVALLLAFTAFSESGHGGEPTSFGSSGVHGAFVVLPGEERVLDLAREGVYDPESWCVRFDFTEVSLGADATVRFLNHPSRAPVAWYVNGSVTLAAGARILLDGEVGEAGGTGRAEPGPGGFRGGRGALAGFADNAAAGLGPGGARGDANDVEYGGTGASHLGSGALGQGAEPGAQAAVYGHPKIAQLVGGSGGGAGRRTSTQQALSGGGAGGGALLIAADGAIDVHGRILAQGGAGGAALPGGAAGGGGSGGSLRIASLTGVQLGDTAQFLVLGGAGGAGAAGDPAGGAGAAGRIRLESPGGSVAGTAPPFASVGEPVVLGEVPRLRVVWIGGQAVPQDEGAALGGSDGVPDLVLPDSGPVTIVVEVEGAVTSTAVFLRVTHATGPAMEYGPQVLEAGVTTAVFDDVSVARGVSSLQARAVVVGVL